MPRGGGAHPASAGKLQKKQHIQKYRQVHTTFVWKVKSNTELSFRFNGCSSYSPVIFFGGKVLMMALSTSMKAGPIDLEHHVFHGMLCMVEVQSGSRGRTLCPSSCSRKECPTFSFLDVVSVWWYLPDACVIQL